MWAVYISTISGTDTAYIYELIVESGLIHRTKHILGYFDSIRNFALLTSTIFAGYLYVVDMRLPILLNSIFALLSALTILLLPKVKIKIKHTPVDQIRLIRDLLGDQPILRYLVLFMALIYTYIWASTLLLQPLLQSFDISISNFGLIYASFPFFAIFGGLTAGSISDRIGDQLHIIITTILIVISMGLIGILPGSWGVIGIISLQFSYSMLQPVLLSRVNNLVSNDLRASVLSFSNLIGSFGLIFCRPLIVLISEITSVQLSYLIWGGLGLLILLFLGLFLTLRNSNYEKASKQ
jgi:predicted MFS family arabinose efflux permease